MQKLIVFVLLFSFFLPYIGAAEFQVDPTSYDQVHPRVGGDYVVWEDLRGASPNNQRVYYKNTSVAGGGAQAPLRHSSNAVDVSYDPDISSSTIVYVEAYSIEVGPPNHFFILRYPIGGSAIELDDSNRALSDPTIDGYVAYVADTFSYGTTLWRYTYTNFEITQNTNNDQSYPRSYYNGASQDYTVFMSNQNGALWDVYLYPYGGMVPIAVGTSQHQYPDVYKNIIVWQDNRNGNWDIWGFNITTGLQFPIITESHDQKMPSIWGDRIAYQDNRNGNWDIYVYDLFTKTETRVTTDTGSQVNPDIKKNRVVWEDSRTGHWNIWESILPDDAPIVTLTSPADGVTSYPEIVFFNCSAQDDYGLWKIELWTNTTGVWKLNQSKTIDGRTGSVSFNITNISLGNYIWNCLAWDDNSNSSSYSSNYSFTIQPKIYNFSVAPLAYQFNADNATNTFTNRSFTVYNNGNQDLTALNCLANVTWVKFHNCPSSLFAGESRDIIAEFNTTKQTEGLKGVRLNFSAINVTPKYAYSTVNVTSFVYNFSVSPASMLFLASSAPNSKTNQSFILANNGNQNLTSFGCTSNASSWVKFYQCPTSLLTGESAEVKAEFDTTGLSDGLKGVLLNFTDAKAGIKNARVTVNVSSSAGDFPPIISNVQNQSTTDNSTKINWNTNTGATSVIDYGTSPGTYLSSIEVDAYVLSHSLDLLDLSPLTTYFYIVTSCNLKGCRSSSEYNFRTSSPLDYPPVVTLIAPYAGFQNISTGITLTCKATDDSGLTFIELYTNRSGGWVREASTTVSGTSVTRSFSISIPAGSYVWNCNAIDSASQSRYASQNNSFTLLAPLSNFSLDPSTDRFEIANQSGSVTNRTFTLANTGNQNLSNFICSDNASWAKVHNCPSTLDASEYAVFEFEINATALPFGIYGIKLNITNSGVGSRLSYMTVNVTESPTNPSPSITGVNATPSYNSALIYWNTSGINSNSTVYFGNDSVDLSSQIGVNDNVQFHQVTITGLKPETKYYYRVESCSLGGCTPSGTYNFNTTKTPPGCLYGNPPCDPGQVCTAQNSCTASNTGSLGGSGNTGNNNGGTTGGAPPSKPKPSPTLPPTPTPSVEHAEFNKISNGLEGDLLDLRNNGENLEDVDQLLQEAKILQSQGKTAQALILLKRARDKIAEKATTVKTAKVSWGWYAAAIAIILVICASGYYIMNMNKKTKAIAVAQVVAGDAKQTGGIAIPPTKEEQQTILPEKSEEKPPWVGGTPSDKDKLKFEPAAKDTLITKAQADAPREESRIYKEAQKEGQKPQKVLEYQVESKEDKEKDLEDELFGGKTDEKIEEKKEEKSIMDLLKENLEDDLGAGQKPPEKKADKKKSLFD